MPEKNIYIRLPILFWICIFSGCLSKNEQEVILLSSIRIFTSLDNFMSEMKLKGYMKRKIDKTYNLPQDAYLNEKRIETDNHRRQLIIQSFGKRWFRVAINP
jgi:hypothetical protein